MEPNWQPVDSSAGRTPPALTAPYAGPWRPQPSRVGEHTDPPPNVPHAAAQDAASAPQPPAGVSYADQLAREARPDDNAPPPGAELLCDPLELDWDQRADVIAAVDDLAPHLDKLTEANEARERGDTTATIDLASVFGKPSDVLRFIGKTVRAMRGLALDPAAFDQWAKHATQQQIFDLYGWVQGSVNLGEN